jgi:hypothetical protein
LRLERFHARDSLSDFWIHREKHGGIYVHCKEERRQETRQKKSGEEAKDKSEEESDS